MAPRQRSCLTKRRLVSRDHNAALNIRRCLHNRPDILKQALAVGKLVQAIVKESTIKMIIAESWYFRVNGVGLG